MTTTMRETDLLAVFRRHMERVSPTTEQYTEQLFNYAGQQRKLDLVLDDEQTLTVIAGKELLDSTAIEQARVVRGVCDFSYVVCRKPRHETSLHRALLAECKSLGIGVTYIIGERVFPLKDFPPARYPMSDPQELRRQLRHRDEELEAGIAGGGTGREYEFKAAFLAALRDAGEDGIRMARVNQEVPGSPYGNNTKTKNKLKRLIDSDELDARYDAQFFYCK